MIRTQISTNATHCSKFEVKSFQGDRYIPLRDTVGEAKAEFDHRLLISFNRVCDVMLGIHLIFVTQKVFRRVIGRNQMCFKNLRFNFVFVPNFVKVFKVFPMKLM